MSSKKRIIGIDVARAIAVVGMIIVNFKMVIGQQGDSWLKAFAQLFEGKAAATFVVLAGVGLALMTNSAVEAQDLDKLRTARKRIIKRAIFLFIIGLSYIWIWPADILHFYGIYMLLTLLLIDKKPGYILLATVGLIVVFPVFLGVFDYEQGWDFTTFEYADFWKPEGFLRNLFFNGFHPVIPWTAFMLFGLWYGKQDLHDDRFVWKSLWISLAVFIAVQIVSGILIVLLSEGDPESINQLSMVLGTGPMPPMPLYMINGISISVTIISLCILLAKRFEKAFIIQTLTKTGQLALTFYVAHVVLGMGLVEEFGSLTWGEYSIQFSVLYALFFSVACMVFAEIWLRYKKAGPLEWVLRKLTN